MRILLFLSGAVTLSLGRTACADGLSPPRFPLTARAEQPATMGVTGLVTGWHVLIPNLFFSPHLSSNGES